MAVHLDGRCVTIPFMNKRRIFITVIIALWLMLIWGHSMQPATVSEHESGRVLAFLGKLFPALLTSENGMFIVRKAAHITEFLILGILLTVGFLDRIYDRFARFAIPALTGLFVAFIDETIQLFVVGRSGEVRDIWIDFSGVILGTLIALAFSNGRRSRRR